jgi:Protein of unknown function (DUF2637)
MSDHPPRTVRRLLTVSSGIGVAVLAGVAFAVTYSDLRMLAVTGHASRRLGPAFPAMFDALITVTILAIVAARRHRWWASWSRWALLLLLLGAAATASVVRAVARHGYGWIPLGPLKAGVAVAPYVMLLVAVWLWLGIFRHVPADPPPPGPGPTVEIPAWPYGPGGHQEITPGMRDAGYEPKHELAGHIPDPEPEPYAEPYAQADAQPEPEPDPEEYTVPSSLPTDVKLVARPPEPAATTQPDLLIPADSPEPAEPASGAPAAFGASGAIGAAEAPETDGEREDEPAEDRAEDPEADLDWTPASTPPSSTFRSSPTPPGD